MFFDSARSPLVITWFCFNRGHDSHSHRAMEALLLMLLFWINKRRQRTKRVWTHRIFERRHEFGEYHHLLGEILSDAEKCISYIRMLPETFESLLQLVGPYIEKRRTNFRKPLSARERLVITLR